MFKNYDIFYDETNVCYQVRSKNTCYVIEFDTDEKYKVFKSLVNVTEKGEDSLLSIVRQLNKEHDEASIIDVLSSLNDFGLIPPEQQSFYHEITNTQPVETQGYGIACQTEVNVLIIGDSLLSERLVSKFSSGYFEKTKFLSTTDLIKEERNNDLPLLEAFDFIIVDAQKWNPYCIELINKSALKYNKPWLFVGGLDEYKFKIGPLFYGKETGCYNCLIKRIKSNNDYTNYLNSYETYLREKKKSSQGDKFIHEDAFNDMVSAIIFLEVTKFFEMWAIPSTWKNFISINGLNYETEKHTLLKVPYCEVCKPHLEYNPSPWLEPITLK